MVVEPKILTDDNHYKSILMLTSLYWFDSRGGNKIININDMELALTKPTMAKGINIKRLLAIRRAKAIKREAELYFHAQVHHCCRVSANNHDIAYLIDRVGIFNGPKVELITRPNEVILSEFEDCVIVKDGYVYEMTKRVE